MTSRNTLDEGNGMVKREGIVHLQLLTASKYQSKPFSLNSRDMNVACTRQTCGGVNKYDFMEEKEINGMT